MSMDKRTFRDACGCFATGVVIATCTTGSGDPVGVTINSFSSVSLEPPLVLFCIDHRATSRTSFLEADAFALNILSSEQRSLADRFAKSSSDKFSGISYTESSNGAPVFSDALVHFLCTPEAQYPGGDHDIIVGRVTAIEKTEADLSPLLYFGGSYRDLTTQKS